eukprot:TRINITY_DN1775_c0_g1_i1.p1 TRINITY_DN1775_c0_g1~~TRINITY_DN1775_c0_g1_i1.p1  ORF type:complete len:140 (+),score=19.31 TRINITY_DN1775_c0_g1_i1:35-454(+)
MPLYDFIVILKSAIQKSETANLLVSVGKKVVDGKGVVCEVRSFGSVFLAYDIKKRDGRHREGQMLQMTVMAPSKFCKELEYLNKDERLLRWMVVKNRGNKWMRGSETSNLGLGPLASSAISPEPSLESILTPPNGQGGI